jgi:hypothetical protein
MPSRPLSADTEAVVKLTGQAVGERLLGSDAGEPGRSTPMTTPARAGSVLTDGIASQSHSPYIRVLDELVPAAAHVTEQYGNNRVEADHGRLRARLRPMRGLKRFRSAAAVIAAGHAFVQNLRRGHYELARDVPAHLRIAAAFTELAAAV